MVISQYYYNSRFLKLARVEIHCASNAGNREGTDYPFGLIKGRERGIKGARAMDNLFQSVDA